jgi:hypothetical protein
LTENFWNLAQTAPAPALFAALETIVQERIGAVIYSASVFDTTRGVSRRVHTNMPEAYPVSGLKQIVPNRWTAIVIDRHETFVANTIEEIAEVFPDADLIASLGCGSVVNLPVCLSGRLLGTLNVLHRTGYFDAQRVAKLTRLRPAGIACFASHSFAGG